jgi:hypothetical protein
MKNSIVGQKKIAATFLLFLTVLFAVHGQESVIFSEQEVSALKNIAKYYSVAALWIGVGVAVLVPILSFFGLRHKIEKWAEDKVMEKMAGQLDIKKEVLQGALSAMIEDYKLKLRKILVVGEKDEKLLQLSEFLGRNNFLPPGSVSAKEFVALGTLPEDINLILFNYLNQDIDRHKEEIIPMLEKFKDKRMLVLGTGRLPDDQKTKYGNRLSFSNGFDTLADRILGAYKQPV